VLLDFTDRSTDADLILRTATELLLSVFCVFAYVPAISPTPVRWPYPVALTIVHLGGTSALPLHNMLSQLGGS
jgi:hypothetical protein